MELTRREFAMITVTAVTAACSKTESPVSPSSLPTTVQPGPQPINYIVSGQNTTNREISMLEAITPHYPILNPPLSQPPNQKYMDRFVLGFNGFQVRDLVFYINDQQYNDLGVMKKMIKPGQRWGCASA